MSKLDALRRSAGSNAAESMGTPRPSAAAAPPVAPALPDRLKGVVRSKAAAEIPVDRIGPDPSQPREEFDDVSLGRLAESLKARGQLQPIRVRWDEGRGLYVILCGERRWRAAQLAGLSTLSAVIVEGELDAGELLSIQLVENCLREDLKPIEQARAFRALIDRNGWSARQVARELSVDQSSVVRALALLDLPPSVQERVERGDLPPATAYEVSKVDDPAGQEALAERVVAEKLSRAEAIAAVRESNAAPAPARAGKLKGRGAAPRKKETSCVVRTATARVTVELRKGSGGAALLAALEEAAAQLRAAQGLAGESSAA